MAETAAAASTAAAAEGSCATVGIWALTAINFINGMFMFYYVNSDTNSIGFT